MAIIILLFFSSIFILLNNQGILQDLGHEQTAISTLVEANSFSNSKNENKTLEMPVEGLSTYIGMSAEQIERILGMPVRIDHSSYDYDWWIYNEDLEQYMQIGIQNNKVVTVFGIGENIDISPFYIGQSYEDILSKVSVNETISFNANYNSYRFELTEEELKTRPLLGIDDVYIQLYFDTFTGNLSSIRFMDEETVVKQRPYELVYRGELLSAKELNETQWRKVEEGAEAQILDITNAIRIRHNLSPVKWEEETSVVAYHHSKDMKSNDYFSHTSPENGGLADRLQKGKIIYQLAGENIAAKYVDGIAAVEGWLNSEGHRETLLNQEFTHLGVGVYEKYYTQNFVQKWEQQ